MNCFVPKPALKKSNSTINKTSTSLLTSKSADNLNNSRSRSRDRGIYLGFRSNKKSEPLVDPATSSFIHTSSAKLSQPSKPHEFENFSQSLFNRYPDTTNLNLDQVNKRLNQNGTLPGKTFVWVIIYEDKIEYKF
jgi:hypothetical protein